MEPITEEQEWTLRRWASTIGKRPRKKDKAFLQYEKGLSGAQIDSWWGKTDLISSKASDSTPGQAINTIRSDNSFELEASSRNFSGGSDQPTLIGDLSFELFDNSSWFTLDYSTGSTQNWSPIGHPENTPSNGPSSMIDVQQNEDTWRSSLGSQDSRRPLVPSIMDFSFPLLSPPSTNRSGYSGSDRSSYGSSLWTANSTSTAFSYRDQYTEGSQDGQSVFRFERDGTIDPTKLAMIPEDGKKGNPTLNQTMGTSNSQDAQATFHSKTISPPQNRPLQSQDPNQQIPKDGIHLYRCTACDKCFNRKGDWKRHEESHDPQKLWTCMPEGPFLSTASGWACVFCDETFGRRDRDELCTHLKHSHNFSQCIHKKPTFTRKDKLKQHLQKVHALSDRSIMWETWNQATRKKFAWGCGYCGSCLFTWEGRMIHVAEHYEKPSSLPLSWSLSMVVKGLLKQFKYPDFRISEAWKEIIENSPTRDHFLEWDDSTAIALKHKLEFHDGLARMIAKQAQRLALNSNPGLQAMNWMPSDSRVSTLLSPMRLEIISDKWENSETGAHQTSPQLSTSNVPTTAVQIHNGDNYI